MHCHCPAGVGVGVALALWMAEVLCCLMDSVLVCGSSSQQRLRMSMKAALSMGCGAIVFVSRFRQLRHCQPRGGSELGQDDGVGEGRRRRGGGGRGTGRSGGRRR